MSILIKGMEMPKRGHTTTITIVGSGQAYVEYFDCRPHVKETIEYTAVPVSPHGDLIDKDATMNAILEEHGEDTACWFAGIVNDMPAIVPSDKAEEGET